MLFDVQDRINLGMGFTGWMLAISKVFLKDINEVIILSSSLLGVIMLIISIRTAVIKYRIKKVELKKLEKELNE